MVNAATLVSQVETRRGGARRPVAAPAPDAVASGHAGPLLPVRQGWLLSRVEGHTPWNLLPRPYRVRALLWAVGPLLLLDLLSAVLGGPTGFSFFGFIVVLRGVRPIADSLIRRALDRTPGLRSLSGRARGDVVRIRGRVRSGPSFLSAGGRWSSVLAAYAGTVEYPRARAGRGAKGRRRGRGRTRRWARPWSELRGIDFVVDLPEGGSVVVATRDAYLLAPPEALLDAGSCRPLDVVTAPLGRVFRQGEAGTAIESVLAELVVAPGDEVEIYGVLDWEVTPAAADMGRAGALAPVLRAGPGVPLVVRPPTLKLGGS
jgi:hypothetical protein